MSQTIPAQTTRPALPYFATCPGGVEPFLAQEAAELGLPRATAEGHTGGVAFGGTRQDAMRACLWLRCAARVLRVLLEGPARTPEQLYATVAQVDWPRWITPRHTFRVDATLQKSSLRHSGFAALKAKDAIVDRIRKARGRRPDVDRERPDVVVRLRVYGERVTVSLDLAGRPLHQRGWRRGGGEAPMKEALAAAVVRASGWDGSRPLYDPFCGGGTIGIEAAWQVQDRAPGLGRGFAFERLDDHDADAWTRLVEDARARRDAGAGRSVRIELSDIDGSAVARARRHASTAGVELNVRQADARRFRPAAGAGDIVTNPPYGERLGEGDEVDALYRAFGDALKRDAGGCDLWLFTGLDRVRSLGLKPRRRIPLFNGPIECRLLHVPLFAGNERDRRHGGRDAALRPGSGED